MSVENIKLIIDILPTIIMYFIPGYILIWMLNFSLDRDTKDDKHIIIKIIVNSYIIISIVKFISYLILRIFYKVEIQYTDIDITKSTFLNIITMIVAVIIGYALSQLILSDWLQNKLTTFNIFRTFHSSIWSRKIDFEYGNWARVYLPEEKLLYLGIITQFEINDKENYFISLSNYISYDYSKGHEDKKELYNYQNSNDKHVVLNVKDINRVEMFYHPDSKKVKEYEPKK